MTERAAHLRAAFAASRLRREPAEPSELLAAIRTLGVDAENYERNADYGKFRDDVKRNFGFLLYQNHSMQKISAEEFDRWADLLAWIVNSLKNWSPDDPSSKSRFRALVYMTHLLDWDDAFWPELPDEIGENEALMSELAQYVRNCRIELKVSGDHMPISSGEMIDSFNRADADGDWVGLIDVYECSDIGFSDQFLSYVVVFLNRFDLCRLVLATNEIRQSPVAATIAQALLPVDAFKLGIESSSYHLKFASMFQNLRRRREPLGGTARLALTELLIQVSANTEVWEAWMKVFNLYPVRFPELQSSLGAALAVCSESAIVAYISAPALNTSPHDERGLITECLLAFRQKALPEVRRALWTAAYKRWSDWNFNRSEERSYLFEISASALDFAVVGYIVEFMDESECQGEIDALCKKVSSLDRDWHASISECISAFNFYLSRLQPFAHAASCKCGWLDWLSVRRQYLVRMDRGESFLKLKYGH